MILKTLFSKSGRAIYSDVFFTEGLGYWDDLYGMKEAEVLKRLDQPSEERQSWLDYLWARNPIAQIGATVYSDGWTKVRAGRKAQPNELGGGNIRIIYWNFASLPAGNIADVLVCGKIYKGDRVIDGREVHSALTSGGATAGGGYGTYLVLADGVSLGAADTALRFLGSTSFEAAGGNGIAQTIALGKGFEATVDVFLTCVNDTEAFATAGQVSGHMMVVR